MPYTVVIDAGHGGSDPGAVYQGRQEKDDTLRLAMEVGRILEENGVNVVYTRTTDVYDTPFQKAQKANQAGADFLVSIHRNSSPRANQYSGVETLVYQDSGVPAEMARNINANLAALGFRDAGVKERPGLVVLRRSRMPAVLVEAGFINSDEDNTRFDEEFEGIAQGIADGILQTITTEDMTSAMARDKEQEEEKEENKQTYFRVQTGVFVEPANAENQLYLLLGAGFPAYIIMEDGYYKVQVGAFEKMDNAIRMERTLRGNGYSTFLVEA